MDSRKYVLQQTALVAAGQAVCTAVMIGVFALIGRFDLSVLWGGIAGAVLATANFFFMSLFASAAADKAEAQDVAGGQKLIQLSYLGRLLVLFLALVLCAKSGVFNLIALVIPLVFTRPILTAAEFVKKKGGKPNEPEC